MRRHLPGLVVLFLALLYGTPAAHAAPVRIVFQLVDSPGEGFRDSTWGASRLAPMRQAASLWSRQLVASYPGETIRIRLQTGDAGIFAGIGGAERTNWDWTGLMPETVYPAALANHRARSDLEPGFAESNITIGESLNNVSRALSWNEKRFYLSLALHEIGHGLGFLTAIQSDGDLSVTPSHPPYPMIYDRFLRSAPGGGQALTGLTDTQRATIARSNRLYWAGARGVAANAGVRPRIYARPTFVEGSSIVHLEGRTHPNALMKTGGGLAPAITSLDLALLRDMGWNTAPLAGAPTASLASLTTAAVAAPTPVALPVGVMLLAFAMGRRRARQSR